MTRAVSPVVASVTLRDRVIMKAASSELELADITRIRTAVALL